MRIFALLGLLAGLYFTAGSDKVSQAATPLIHPGKLGQSELLVEVQKAWPKTGKKIGKKGKGKKGKGKKSSGKSGKCGRLAEKYGWPKSECRSLKGEKKCGQLAEKHGLSKKECRSL
jgi:hypothetical protein